MNLVNLIWKKEIEMIKNDKKYSAAEKSAAVFCVSENAWYFQFGVNYYIFFINLWYPNQN